ncbi:MAG: tyrosine-type recombinase/integrase [Sphingomonadaceae bacterium]|nr:tyrosine-type recombinase/integrase [Sphingomonadaceae bacterium]
MGRLTALQIKTAKPGRHGDGDGLYLLVKPSGSRSWLLRVQVDGKRRDIGLGAVDLSPTASDETIDIPLLHRRRLSLSAARAKCAILRRAAEAGLDPKVERDKDRKGVPSFREAAEACHAALQGNWAPRQQASFLSSLERHAYPAFGDRRVDQIEAHDIRDMLAAIWTEIPDMARKVRQRVGMVLNFARSKNWRKEEAPGKSVTMGLSKPARGGNYAAMPYAEVPGFVAALSAKSDTPGRLALLFTIFTAARSGEVRNARWSHIDLAQRLWSRPAELMKARVSHVVTLNQQALSILKRAALLRTRETRDALVFPSSKATPLSDMTLSKIMRDGDTPFTVHGFRSSFRDWAAEKMPMIPEAVAEAALAHAVPDKTVRAYKRTTFIEMRRELLDAWGRFAGETVPECPLDLGDGEQLSPLMTYDNSAEEVP